MTDNCNMNASLAFFGRLPHMGKHECRNSSMCALSKFVDTLSPGEFFITTVKHRVYTFRHFLLEIDIPTRTVRPRFSLRDAKVLFAEQFR